MIDIETYDCLIKALTALKLSYIRENLDDYLKLAEAKNLSHLEVLFGLMQKELKERKQKTIQKRLKAAGFPQQKSLEAFDFNFQTSVKKQKLINLAEGRWIETKTNIIFLGPPGTGKTHLSIALGIEAIKRGYKVYFIPVQELVDRFYTSLATGEIKKLFKKLLSYDCIILDEIGYLPLDKKAANYLFQLISKCYERKSLIVSSNKGFEQWGEIFSDGIIATAILDRLLHHSEIFLLRGESYRMKGKMEKGGGEN